MEEKIEQVKTFIEHEIDIENLVIPEEYFYTCLPLCLLDAVYSIGARYSSTRNVVKRYCCKINIQEFRNHGEETPQYVNHRIDDLITEIGKTEDAIYTFASEVVKNRQRTSTTNGILKAEAVLKCANVLKEAEIQTIGDFNDKMSSDDETVAEIEDKFKGVKGQHSGISFSYLKMLCGDENSFKPDRHILRFLSCALGYEVDKEEAECLIPKVADRLKTKNPILTVRTLDYAIWNKMRSEGQKTVKNKK